MILPGVILPFLSFPFDFKYVNTGSVHLQGYRKWTVELRTVTYPGNTLVELHSCAIFLKLGLAKRKQFIGFNKSDLGRK